MSLFNLFAPLNRKWIQWGWCTTTCVMCGVVPLTSLLTRVGHMVVSHVGRWPCANRNHTGLHSWRNCTL